MLNRGLSGVWTSLAGTPPASKRGQPTHATESNQHNLNRRNTARSDWHSDSASQNFGRGLDANRETLFLQCDNYRRQRAYRNI